MINMTAQEEKSILLNKYEKIKGYSSNLFDNEEWTEFNAFCLGYKLAMKENTVTNSITKKMYQAIVFALNYDNRKNREKDDYEVSFLYPANNLSFQRLLKAVRAYEEIQQSADSKKLF